MLDLRPEDVSDNADPDLDPVVVIPDPMTGPVDSESDLLPLFFACAGPDVGTSGIEAAALVGVLVLTLA